MWEHSRSLPNTFTVTSFPLAQTLVTVTPLGGPVPLLTREGDLGDTGEASFDKSPKQGLSGVLEWTAIVGTGSGHREGTGTRATGVWRGEHTAAGGLEVSTANSCLRCSALTHLPLPPVPLPQPSHLPSPTPARWLAALLISLTSL